MSVRSQIFKQIVLVGGAFAALAMSRAQAPNIASFDPYHGPVGATIGITGNNLGTVTQVKFNGVPATDLTILGPSSITVVVPVGATTGKLSATNPSGTYTTSVDFLVDGTGGGGTGGGTGGSSGGGDGDSSAFVYPPNIAVPAGAMVGHPRIFITQADLPKLRTWASPSNTVWNGLVQLANTAKARMDNGEIVDAAYGNGNVPAPTESYAEIFALMSLVHPDPSVREDFGNRAHLLIMKVFNEAAKGMDDGQPFRGHVFATDNRASWYGEGFPLTVDWIYDRFSDAEKAKIRRVFLRWIQENCHASTTAQEHPKPLNTYNDPALVDSDQKIRWATNNYYTNHAREVGLMSMALDEVDDIPTLADDAPAGTLRKFVGNAIQAWLYQMNKFEETAGAGGISPEGLGYGELSTRATAFLLLAMHTTGVDRPDVYGPAAATLNGPYWTHDVIDGYIHLLSPSQTVQENWIGPTYLPFLFSDTAQYKNVDYVRIFGALAIHAMHTGDTARYMKLRWMIDNLPPGGVAGREERIARALDGSSVTLGIFYFLSCDPNVGSVSDPRGVMPTEHFAPGLGILSSRTDWTPNASWFVSKASWNTVDHQFGDANGFGYFRAGEWLTKPRLGYGSAIGCSDYQNTLSLENPCTTNISFWMDNLARGSQWIYDPAGDPTNVVTSFGPAYAFTQADATNLYNNPMLSAMDVAHASRSTFFLKPDVVVTYDRATSNSANRYKRYWLNTSAKAKITGKTARVIAPSGQRLFVDTLLPAAAVLTASAGEALDGQPAYLEPMTFRLKVEDPSNPQNVRFLNVIQGVNADVSKIASQLLQSQSGTPFDGVVVLKTAILFKRNMYETFTNMTFEIAKSVKQRYVTGLTPNAFYTVGKVVLADTVVYTITPGGTKKADAGGLLNF